MKEEKTLNRRVLKVRDARYAKKIASWLSGKSVTPNQISLASIGFAALSAVCFSVWRDTSVIMPLLAALFIQMRLLCNLFDGMVAVEGKKSTASGELFNDVPDRAADVLILVAAGYSIMGVSWGGELGWFVGVLAVLTAYVRTLTTSMGVPADFQGPMAKQHRMALLTAGCILASLEQVFFDSNNIILLVLLVMATGCMFTLYRRLRHAYLFLEKSE